MVQKFFKMLTCIGLFSIDSRTSNVITMVQCLNQRPVRVDAILPGKAIEIKNRSPSLEGFAESSLPIIFKINSGYYTRVRGYRKYCRSKEFDIDRGRERPRSISDFRGATKFCDIPDPECYNRTGQYSHRRNCRRAVQ
jgi:hypothetical protein